MTQEQVLTGHQLAAVLVLDFRLQHCEKSMPLGLGHSGPSTTVSPHAGHQREVFNAH